MSFFTSRIRALRVNKKLRNLVEDRLTTVSGASHQIRRLPPPTLGDKEIQAFEECLENPNSWLRHLKETAAQNAPTFVHDTYPKESSRERLDPVNYSLLSGFDLDAPEMLRKILKRRCQPWNAKETGLGDSPQPLPWTNEEDIEELLFEGAAGTCYHIDPGAPKYRLKGSQQESLSPPEENPAVRGATKKVELVACPDPSSTFNSITTLDKDLPLITSTSFLSSFATAKTSCQSFVPASPFFFPGLRSPSPPLHHLALSRHSGNVFSAADATPASTSKNTPSAMTPSSSPQTSSHISTKFLNPANKTRLKAVKRKAREELMGFIRDVYFKTRDGLSSEIATYLRKLIIFLIMIPLLHLMDLYKKQMGPSNPADEPSESRKNSLSLPSPSAPSQAPAPPTSLTGVDRVWVAFVWRVVVKRFVWVWRLLATMTKERKKMVKPGHSFGTKPDGSGGGNLEL